MKLKVFISSALGASPRIESEKVFPENESANAFEYFRELVSDFIGILAADTGEVNRLRIDFISGESGGPSFDPETEARFFEGEIDDSDYFGSVVITEEREVFLVEVSDPENVLDNPVAVRDFANKADAVENFEIRIGKTLADLARGADESGTDSDTDIAYDITPVFEFGESDGDITDYLEKVDFFPTRNGAPVSGSLVRIILFRETFFNTDTK